ncbi:MAG: HEAT repeat domain-containing protein [Verrucomicrobia bacterium]|nr:HEAT repeat domain-containing protein [Verrucomicrobiota bacterium]
MPPTLAQLVTVRSQLAEAVLDYLRKLEQKLDRTPWFRDGKFIAASAIAVPMRVLKESTRPDPPERDRFRERAPSSSEGGETDDPARREAARDYVDPEIAALYEEASGEKRQEEVPWQQERLQVHRAVVLGGPGSGKSFLTQTTALGLARAARDAVQKRQAGLDTLELPLHFTLARFADPALPPDPLDAVLELARLDFSPPPCFLPWLKQRLHSRTTWLILDALDEVREDHRPALTERLQAIETQGWQTRVLLTCRPANYSREQIPWGELTEYELAPFNPLEIRQFVQRWFASDKESANALSQALDRNYSLAHAARTPLIATFLCLAHQEAPVSDKTRRAELYAHVVRGLARHAWKEKPLARTDPHVDDLVRFLIGVARPLFQRHPAGNLFTHAELMDALRNTEDRPRAWIDGKKETNAPDDLRDELLEAGILVGAGLRDGVETQFSFAHRSLLEYLVARNLSEEAKTKGWSSIEAFADRKSWHPAWREPILFLAGLLAPDDALALLALLADKSTDDVTRQRLCLAGNCLPELTESALQIFLQASQSTTKPTRHPKLQDIAAEILEIWWKNERWNMRFNCVTNTLPALGAACSPHLVPALIRRLESKSGPYGGWWERLHAAEALGRLGSGAATPEVLACLTNCLRIPEATIPLTSSLRERASEALGRLGHAAATPEVLARLTEWLCDSQGDVRRIAVRTLGRLGPAAATELVANRLTDCLGDPEKTVGWSAVAALKHMGGAVATESVLKRLTEWLHVPDSDISEMAGRALAQLGEAAATAPVVSRLTELLRDPDRDVRGRVALKLHGLNALAAKKPVLNQLTECLRDQDKHVRMMAAGVLGQVGGAAATDAVLSRLIEWLRDPDWLVRQHAANTLGRFGSAAATDAVANRLVECLRDPEQAVWGSAVEALGQLGAAVATEPVLTQLSELLRGRDGHVCWRAMWALVRLGPSAMTPPVLNQLLDWLCKQDSDLAWMALRDLGPAAATKLVLNRLTGWLREPLACHASNVTDALKRMGASASELVLSPLTEGLRDPDPLVRQRASYALGQLGPAVATDAVISRLTECLGDLDKNTRKTAAWALGQLGPAAATDAVMSRLSEGPRDRDMDFYDVCKEAVKKLKRETLLRWLGALGAKAATETAGSQLTECLDDPDRQVRASAAEALARLGPAAASDPVVTRLTKLLRDSGGEWRHDTGGDIRRRAAEALVRLGPAATGVAVSQMTMTNSIEDRGPHYEEEALTRFLQAGIRWFAKDGGFHFTTVQILSGDKSASDAVHRGSS